MVSVLFAMGQDRELPRPLTRLNYSGVPWIGLIAACIAPLIVLAIVRDVEILAELYVIGVCGAVTTNILSCAINRQLAMGRGERIGMWALGVLLAAITITIIITKPRATLFAGIVIGVVLATRLGLKVTRAAAPEPLPTPATGWLAEIKAAPAVLDPRKPRIMLAARGRYQSEFAVDLARRRGAVLFVIFVRTLRVMDLAPGKVPLVDEDPDAQEALGTTALLAREAGVPFVPIYITSTDIAGEILDYTVTYGCDTLVLGKSRRSLFSRRVAGDVVAQVAEHLPENVQLILRAGDAPFIPGASDQVEHVTRKKDELEEDVPPT
jgi:nucleotide-binding universal stress UspA family protein